MRSYLWLIGEQKYERTRVLGGVDGDLGLAGLEAVQGGGGGPSPGRASRRAIAAVSSMVGALLISRAVDDKSLSDEILGAVRTTVEADRG